MVALLKGSHDSQTTAAEVAERNGAEFLLVSAAETRAQQRAVWKLCSTGALGGSSVTSPETTKHLANEVVFSTEPGV